VLLGTSGAALPRAQDTGQVQTPAPIRTALAQALHARWVQIVLACVGLAAVAGIVALLFRGYGEPASHSGSALAVLARSFPDAPRTYGDRAPGTLPVPSRSGGPPAPSFSWIGKVDATGLRFVASRRGIHFYRIDDPRAVLIREEDFVGFKTAAEAEANGKQLAE